MEVQERLGELLLVGFPGEEMNGALAEHILTLQPAGLIFFKRNIRSPEQLAQLTRQVQELAVRELGRPLLLAVDQEGGTVARMPPPFTQLPDAEKLGGRGPQSVGYYTGLAAREIYQMGLNLNLAPVLDISTLASADFMQKRCFGSDPALVAQCGIAAISATQEEGIMATAKHFPGLGRAQRDPHQDLPIVSAEMEDLYARDILPFKSAIQAKVACVMTSHALYKAFDANLPGTFSPFILRGLLRDQLGFDGVIITDDLEMGAVDSRYPIEDAASAALKAGADLLLVCNDSDNMHLAAEALRRGLDRGFLDRGELALSVARVERLRRKYLSPLTLAEPAAADAFFSRDSDDDRL